MSKNATYRFPAKTYADAYKNIFTDATSLAVPDTQMLAEAISTGENELAAFQGDLKLAKHMPIGMLEFVGDGSLRDPAVKSSAAAADKQKRDMSQITEHLNNTLLLMPNTGTPLERIHTQSTALKHLMPEGSAPATWPRLMLVCNSNLATPQSFYDEMCALRDIAKNTEDPAAANGVIAIGAFHSVGHTPANAAATIARASELQKAPYPTFENVSPTSIRLKETIESLLLKRDADGKPIMQNGKPVLRDDRNEIMEHIVVGGYSGGYLAATDALRLLKQDIHHEKYATGPDDAILSHISTLGIAGVDVNTTEKNPWSGTNFVSSQDASIASAGGKALKFHPDTKLLLDKKPLDGGVLAGHGLEGYRTAILGQQLAKEPSFVR